MGNLPPASVRTLYHDSDIFLFSFRQVAQRIGCTGGEGKGVALQEFVVDTRSGAFFHLGQLDGRIAGEVALCQQRGQFAFAKGFALHRFQLCGVHCRERNIEADVGQIGVRETVPATDITGLFGQFGNAVRRQRLTGGEGDGVHHAVVIDEADGDDLEDRIKTFQRDEIVMRKGLGGVSIAHAVDGADVGADGKVVVPSDSFFVCFPAVVVGFRLEESGTFAPHTQNRAGFLGAGELHHAAAVGDGETLARNAAHIGVSGNVGFGAALADIAAALAHDAAYIVGVLRVNAAGAETVFRKPQRHPAHDAAHVLALRRNASAVFTAEDHGAQLGVEVHGVVPADLQIVLRIQTVFIGNGTHDAACVQVAQNRTGIGAFFHLAGENFCGVPVGNVLNGAAQILGGVANGGAHGADLPGNGAHDAAEGIRRVVDGIHDGVQRGTGGGKAAVGVVDGRVDGVPVGGIGVIPVGQQGIQSVLGIHEGIVEVVHLNAHVRIAVLNGGKRLPREIAYGAKLGLENLHCVLGVLDEGGRLHLADDAAHFLAAINLSKVFTFVEIPGLGSGNAADVVAHVLIAHVATVFALADDAAAGTGDTADVRYGADGFASGDGLQGNVGELNLVFLGGGVDPGAVVAAADNAKVISHDATDPVVAGDDAFGMAAVDDTGDGVDAGDAAHVIRAGNRAVKEAVLDFTGIVSGNAAYGAAAPVGDDFSRDREVLNERGSVNIAEKSHIRAVPGDAEAGDGVTVAVKIAAENGNPCKIYAGEVNIRQQNHTQVPAVAVQTAVFRKVQKLLLTQNAQGRSFFGGRCLIGVLGFLGQRRYRQAENEKQTQQKRGNSFYQVTHCLLLLPLRPAF